MNYLKFIQILKNDLIKSTSNFKTVKFFIKDFVTFWVWFHVLEQYYNKKPNSIEKILQEIPSGYTSRPTVFKIIDNAISKKYFEKIKNKNDKRQYNLLPTSITVKEFEEWAKVFKGF